MSEQIYWSVTTPSAPRTLQSAKDDTTTRQRMHCAVVADKMDLFLTYERAAEIETIFDRKEATKKLYFLCH